MKQVTKLMIREYHIKELGHDFMGYSLNKGDQYTFHHLLIPKRYGGKEEISNGAILCGKSSHPYLHLIEYIDPKKFDYITYEMIEMNKKGELTIESLQKIDEILCLFEYENRNKKNSKGKSLIKREYRDRCRF